MQCCPLPAHARYRPCSQDCFSGVVSSNPLHRVGTPRRTSTGSRDAIWYEFLLWAPRSVRPMQRFSTDIPNQEPSYALGQEDRSVGCKPRDGGVILVVQIEPDLVPLHL
jgi:hypothetical protein